MHKKSILLFAALLIIGCRSNNITSLSSVKNSYESLDTSSNLNSSIYSEEEKNTSSEESSIILTTSQESSSEEDLSKELHDFYLENSKKDKYTLIPIQGKFIGYEKYEKNPNCNAFFQDGKYGYYCINLPFTMVELNKSYQIIGMSLERNYYGINAKCDEFTLLEVEEIIAETIDLNMETPTNDDYIGAKVKIKGTINSINGNQITINLQGETYNISYNEEVISATEIATKWKEFSVGKEVELSGILHESNREIRIIDATDIN